MSLRENKKLDLSKENPNQTMSTNSDENVKAILQAGYDVKYTAEITSHAARVQLLQVKLTKAFSLILTDYCTPGMQI